MWKSVIAPLKSSGSLVRTLYTVEALGVDKYLYSRDKITSQFVNSADKFKVKMQVRKHGASFKELNNICNK